MNFYYCDVCHYCFEEDTLPDRCPDCGAVDHDEKPAVRPASKDEIDELLRLRADDEEGCMPACSQ